MPLGLTNCGQAAVVIAAGSCDGHHMQANIPTSSHSPLIGAWTCMKVQAMMPQHMWVTAAVTRTPWPSRDAKSGVGRTC